MNIGQVTAVQLSPDHSKVEVTAKIAKSAAGLMVEDAKFWVVEPRVTLSGVSGLGTLLSGNFIGFEVGKSDKQQRTFTGLEVPPIITGGQPGRQFVLKANDLGSLGIGSPIYYRRLQVGPGHRVRSGERWQGDGHQDLRQRALRQVRQPGHALLERERHRRLGRRGRRGGAHGVSRRAARGRPRVRHAALRRHQAEPAAANTVFTLYGDQPTAMKQPESISARYVLYFNESLRGLSVGAPVTLLGLPAGEVTEVGLDIDPATMNIRGRVEIVTYPERLIARLSPKQAAAGETIERSMRERHAFVQAHGREAGAARAAPERQPAHRAALRRPRLLPERAQGEDRLEPGPDGAAGGPEHRPGPRGEAHSIVAKLDKLPLEAIGDDLTKGARLPRPDAPGREQGGESHRRRASRPGSRRPSTNCAAAIATADRVLKNTDATLVGKDAPAQQDLRDALQEITRAARSLRVLTDYLERHPESLIRGKTEEQP